MLWLWIVIIAEIASVIAGVWFYLKKVKGLELQLKQEAEARTQEALELAVAVEARKHLEEASERMLDDVKTLLLVRDQLHDDLDDQKQEIETTQDEEGELTYCCSKCSKQIKQRERHGRTMSKQNNEQGTEMSPINISPQDKRETSDIMKFV